MRKFLILILTVTILGCSGTKSQTVLSELTIENRKENRLIVDRKPDYGITGRDGCVVMEEISMEIMELNNSLISGKVFDSKTKEPLKYARLNLYVTKNGQADRMKVLTDSKGFYKSELNGKLEKIEVQYIAYRDLKIDFKR